MFPSAVFLGRHLPWCACCVPCAPGERLPPHPPQLQACLRSPLCLLLFSKTPSLTELQEPYFLRGLWFDSDFHSYSVKALLTFLISQISPLPSAFLAGASNGTGHPLWPDLCLSGWISTFCSLCSGISVCPCSLKASNQLYSFSCLYILVFL